MKRLFFAASLLFGLGVLFPSCEKSGAIDNEQKPSDIVGCWVYGTYLYNGEEIYPLDFDKIDEYLEFTETGHVKVYSPEHGYASYKNGELSYSGKWVFEETYMYWIEDGLFYYDWGETNEFEMISKDEFCLTGEYKGGISKQYYLRVRKFSK